MPDTMISTAVPQRGGTTPYAAGQPGGAESGSADFAGLLAAAGLAPDGSAAGAGQAASGKAPAAGRHKAAPQAVADQPAAADPTGAAQALSAQLVVTPVPLPPPGAQTAALSGNALPPPSPAAGIDVAGLAADAALAGTVNGVAPAAAVAPGAGPAAPPATPGQSAGAPAAPVSDSAVQPDGEAATAAPPAAPETLPVLPDDATAALPAAAAVAGAVPVPRPSASGADRAPGAGGSAGLVVASPFVEEGSEEDGRAATAHGPTRPAGRGTGAGQHGRAPGEEGKVAALPQQSQAAAAAAAAGGGSAEPVLPATPEGARSTFTVEALPPPAAQAATHYATSAAAGTAPAVGRPLPSAAEQMATPLLRVAAAGGGEFQIELTPAGLGHVRVVAEVNDGQVSLRVQTERADTLDIIRADLRHLERSLGDAGFKLDGAAVQFSLRGDEGSQGRAGGFAGGGGAGGGRSNPWQAEHEPQQQAERLLPPLDGLVDVTV